MGLTGQSVTLANSIIGVGILAMPFCFQRCGVLLATLILLFMGLVSRLCCYFLLKSALLARRRNFEFLAFHVFGSAGKMAVEVGIIGFLMGTCIAYFVVVGDLGPQIIAKMFNINQSDILRTSIMVIVSLVCVLPLGLLRNVDSLSNVSAATIAFYFILVMKVITEAASQLLSGEWHTHLEMWKPAGMLQCVPIFSMALFCQTQLFEIFESLPTLSLEKMSLVTKNAINICTGVYLTLGVFGYIAFCSQEISGNILMSLSPTMASDVIKLGFVMSVAFSFPLIIFPCRASLYSFLYKKVHSSHHDHIINHSIPETTFRCITVAIIAIALFISLLLPNIELVLGLVGSTIGVLICVVFPAACFVNVTFKNTNERVLAKGIVVLGLIIMVLGTYANLQAAENQLDRYDDKYITQEKIDKMVEDFFEKMEKSEDVIVKPEQKNDPVQKDVANGDKEVAKDSEVQPPNPVPPESQSNEKNKNPVEEPKEDVKLKAVPAEVDPVDKVSESHPKNLKTRLNGAKLVNGDTINNNIEKSKEPAKPSSAEEKSDILKKQQLIETIKQHGEEQKELIKEQKEILDEIVKAKKEMEQNKNENAGAEAKKIAVESIKQIANMAIQSLGGVSEKPVGVVEDEKKSEHLEKLANEAVAEIAKKAIETIEVIKEINEKSDQPVPKAEGIVVNNNVQPDNIIPPVMQNKVEANQNVQPNLQNPVQEDSDPSAAQVANENNLNSANAQIIHHNNMMPNQQAQIINAPPRPVVNAQPVIKNNLQPVNNPPIQQPQAQNNQQPRIQNQQPQVQYQQPQIQNNQQPQIQNQQPQIQNQQPQIQNQQPQVQNQQPQIQNQQSVIQNQQPQIQNQQPQIRNQPNVINTLNKEHSHSPDEPQSYKQGEDTQKIEENPINNIIKNVPLPLAKDVNSQINKEVNPQQNVNAEAKYNNNINVQNNLNNVQSNGAKDIKNEKQNIEVNNVDSVIRQKREVVDCTEKNTLQPQDKQICETLVIPQINKEILPSNVDMNSVALPKSLPLDVNVLHHISRSLQSYNEDKKR